MTTPATTTAPAVPQKSRRSAPFAIFLLRLALDAQAGMRQGIEPIESDVLAALLALAELLGRLVEAPQRLVHVPEIATLLRREQERLRPLHRVRALVRPVQRDAPALAVGRLTARVDGL